MNQKTKQKNAAKILLACYTFLTYNLLCSLPVWAQDGSAGLTQATSLVKGYFDAGCNLMYAIGAIVGLVGAVKVLCAMNCFVA